MMEIPIFREDTVTKLQYPSCSGPLSFESDSMQSSRTRSSEPDSAANSLMRATDGNRDDKCTLRVKFVGGCCL